MAAELALDASADAAALSAIERQLQAAGLELLGTCAELSQRTPGWRHGAALLEDMNAQETDILGSLMHLVRARPGQVLVSEGEVGDWMLLLLSGTVDVTKRSEQGGTSRLAVIKQGAAVGEMSMLDAAPRYATCIAIEEVCAGVLTRAHIATLIREHPAVGAKLMVKLTQLLAQRLRNTSNQLVKLLQKQT